MSDGAATATLTPPVTQLRSVPIQQCACEEEESIQRKVRPSSPYTLSNPLPTESDNATRSSAEKGAYSLQRAPIQRFLGLELIPRKYTLLTRIADVSWISDLVDTIDTDAHPKHRMQMLMQIGSATARRTPGLMRLGRRIITAMSEAELNTIEAEYTAYVITQKATLAAELISIESAFRLVEQLWVLSFLGHGPFEKDPTDLNKSGKKAHLHFQPGIEGKVRIITRSKFNWTVTSAASAAGIGAWTDAEKQTFMNMFQTQLDDVWNTETTLPHAPFRVEKPEDYLLKNSPLRWSNLTAHMKGEMSEDTSGNEHFTITVTKRDPATESGLRAHVGGGSDATAHFYMDNAQAGYDSAGNRTGAQHTLAHEWMHMIGNPDEYTENSSSQSQEWANNGGTTANSLGSNQWASCQALLTYRSMNPFATPEERAQAKQDLNDLRNQYQDSDPATPGMQSRIFNLANRPDIPDTCFAVRGAWSGPRSVRLRPGGRSQRGGTHISMNAEDRNRLSHVGNEVHAYHREGILVELNNTLKEATDPEVQFEHNFQDMSLAERLETLEGRLNNIHWDLVALQQRLNGTGGASGGGSSPEDEPHTHEH